MDDLLALASESARAAGRAVLRYAGAADLHVRAKGAAGAPVTDADLASQQVLMDALAPTGYAILSEERSGNGERIGQERVWIVDPLDGTKDFLHGTDEYCVMVGLVERGCPILGAIFAPATDTLFFATAHGGAWRSRNGSEPVPVTVTSRCVFASMTMLVSRNHLLPVEVALAERLGVGRMIACGSAGVKACRIAMGEADIYVNSSNQTGEWDTAAAECIVREAGGIVTDMDGYLLTYNKAEPRNSRGFVITNPTVHGRVLVALCSDLIVTHG